MDIQRRLAAWTPRLVLAWGAAALTAGVLCAQAPTFRSGVDVVIVEAIVLDKAGAAVKGLQPADFAVEVDGKPREIVLAELVEFTPPARDALQGSVDITTNAPTDAGRTVLLLIDQNSLRPESRGVLGAAQRWVDALGPDDRVGLMSFPPSGPRLDFTTDHAKVAAVLSSLVGSAMPTPGFRNIGLSEAVRIYEGDTFSYQQAVARECRATDPLCPPDVREQARQMVFDAQAQVMPALNAMRAVMGGLAALPGPKHAVLISAGWMISERETMPEMRDIAIQAARSNVTVHSFTDDRFSQTSARWRPSPTPFQDQQLLFSTVEALSGMTGGRAVRLTGSYDDAFDGLNSALSGYYRLGIRALPEDLGGKEHRISLKVRRPGASLASYRRLLVVPPGTSAAPGDPAVSLRTAIEGGAALTTLGLRATTYVLHGTTTAPGLRVVVAGEVARAVGGKATLVAAVYQPDGTPVVAREAPLDVPADGTAPLAISLDVPPGSYVVRLAVRDSEGRLGSLERRVEARWQTVGRVETPGLVLFRTAPGASPTPVLDSVGTGDEITAQLALGGASREARVEIDITAVGSQEPLVRRVPRIRETTTGQAVVHETMPASSMPPGRYTIRALVSGSDVAFTRTFTVVQ